MSIFAIIMILTLVITTILFFWLKRKAKKSIYHIAQVVAPNIQNRANPNIGSNGRNVNLLGTFGTCLFASIFTAAILMTLINYHYSDSIAEGIFLVPVIMSFICPSTFYCNNPQSFGIIKDTLF